MPVWAEIDAYIREDAAVIMEMGHDWGLDLLRAHDVRTERKVGSSRF